MDFMEEKDRHYRDRYPYFEEVKSIRGFKKHKPESPQEQNALKRAKKSLKIRFLIEGFFWLVFVGFCSMYYYVLYWRDDTELEPWIYWSFWLAMTAVVVLLMVLSMYRCKSRVARLVIVDRSDQADDSALTRGPRQRFRAVAVQEETGLILKDFTMSGDEYWWASYGKCVYVFPTLFGKIATAERVLDHEENGYEVCFWQELAFHMPRTQGEEKAVKSFVISQLVGNALILLFLIAFAILFYRRYQGLSFMSTLVYEVEGLFALIGIAFVIPIYHVLRSPKEIALVTVKDKRITVKAGTKRPRNVYHLTVTDEERKLWVEDVVINSHTYQECFVGGKIYLVRCKDQCDAVVGNANSADEGEFI